MARIDTNEKNYSFLFVPIGAIRGLFLLILRDRS